MTPDKYLIGEKAGIAYNPDDIQAGRYFRAIKGVAAPGKMHLLLMDQTAVHANEGYNGRLVFCPMNL